MDELPLITTLAAGFTAAWVLGLLTQRLRLSPIVGYLLAGIIIGPHTPGFTGDPHLAHQLAEVGVILLMFGVGLHFHLADLVAVKGVAIPGALGQSLVATAVSIGVFALFGLDPQTSAVIGMAMAVASTVVLMRVLLDADALETPAGHVAVGWLLVEDVMTVIVLVLIPVLGTPESAAAAAPAANPLAAIAWALFKLAALVAIVLFVGSRIVPWALLRVARLRSRELFTLTVMVFSVAIAAGAYELFGASMALGAFLAGMMVAQSPVSHQAAADALPLRDAFAVLFFVAVGMLFDPMFLVQQPLMMLGALGIILLVKPLIALVIVGILGHSVRTALTVALGLAQIGEFSFILSDAARKYGLMPDEGHNVLVGGAIISITLNPMLFRSIDGIEQWLRRHPRLWKLLNGRADQRLEQANLAAAEQAASHAAAGQPSALVVGFGPVGQTVDRLLQEAGLRTVIIDMNADTVLDLQRQGRTAIFGDAATTAILEQAGAQHASHLVLTLPQAANRAAIVATARNLNRRLKVFVRARYLREREELERAGASAAIFEEAEAAVALARLVLSDAGAGREHIDRAVRDIRLRLILDNVSNLRVQSVRNIMIPWTRVRRLAESAALDEVRRQLGEQRFSRWPVVDDQTGTPLGYLLAKDLITLDAASMKWTELIRPLMCIGPDDDIETTLVSFQRDGATIGLVQEGDIPLGIVTIEDILEQVIGRMEDEYPRHSKLLFREVLLVDDDLLHIRSRTAEEAIAEMAARIPAQKLPPSAEVAKLAIAREHELPTHIGGGVALPHARCPGLGAPIVVFGRSADGVNFGGSSSDQVHLIFLLVTPLEQPHVQVQLLSQVAGVAGNAEVRVRLSQIASAREAWEILLVAGDQQDQAAAAVTQPSR
ncbi:MAG: cation:proton antiporter [Planctomycetaceae bacterium]|nr:cation:proton antiporter [Planctomycetaceae bacterium]